MQDIIAVVFDFDDTLAPDSTSSFLASKGLDVKRFWREDVQPLLNSGWDPIPAYLYRMIRLSNSGELSITHADLAAWGLKVKLFNGVNTLFRQLRTHLASIHPGVQVEFYLISSGLGEILRNTQIAKHFAAIWACDFEYGPDERINFPKRIVSFTDKTRYLFYVSKGLIGPEYDAKPFEVNRKVPDNQLRVPFDQMIFVGDGYTDIPCFSLVRKAGGVALGVYDPNNSERWGRAWGFIEDGRVSNLVPADYGKSRRLSVKKHLTSSPTGCCH